MARVLFRVSLRVRRAEVEHLVGVDAAAEHAVEQAHGQIPVLGDAKKGRLSRALLGQL